jgi:hypothetical protein
VETEKKVTKEFKRPNFKERCIETRVDEEEVSIYATAEGLRKLISYCETLLKNPNEGHIHMEDYEVLSDDSWKTTLVIDKQSEV